ncbi:hypothetical protein L0156_27100, partial [bacterium]|nr:hypothetical protein [bacterium]
MSQPPEDHSSQISASDSPEPEVVRAHLESILKSSAFIRSERMIRFLRFSVEECLQERADQINEYRIAVEVYDRPSSFDPHIDATIRVEAGRLRSKLREYYETEGKESAIRIDLPKGSYIPVFKRVTVPAKTIAIREHGLKTIAVLPFADMSPQRDQEYLSDGIAEEIMFQLSRVEGVRVAAQTSVFAFKGAYQDIRDIGKKLGVEAVLEGSVRKYQNTLRIRAQLIDVSSGLHIWSDVYESELEDVFKIQGEISRSVVLALMKGFLQTTGDHQLSPSTASMPAYDAYLKGRFHWNRQSEDGLKMALSEFNRAIASDPGFARAYVGLSDCYRLLEFWGDLSPQEAYPKAKSAALTALNLDSSLAEARASLAALKAIYEWDWAASEEEFLHVLRIIPNYPIGHQA